ncbi:hypothetical protein [Pontivivens insulae]|uniref:Uncharacterized protein n=1 Tax=Pontivivens insulae TaxID=1639689 RepID=A0A2R8A6W8_9RHOB|nr:hypothetical protein [Pontivivens insulae]RED18080.1 hypothetical protein DFR53_0272 [Pontivivens insulae]SPF27977.1 hypothetical protein POI8812_00272 [Pontivivens insulae]
MFKRSTILALSMVAGLSAAGAAQACPDYSLNGTPDRFSSTDAWTERRYPVIAGGSVDLARCGSVPGVGNVARAPDFTFYYTHNANHSLRFQARAGCDTVLMVNDATGRWHWDDDSAGGTNAEVHLYSPRTGYVDVWVGTYGSGYCDATLHVESF